MSLIYPRFLFSTPGDTQNHAIFILHFLRPRFVCRLTRSSEEGKAPVKNYFKEANGWTLELIEIFEISDFEKVSEVMEDMLLWALKQDEIAGEAGKD
jgi:hypothetical protein